MNTGKILLIDDEELMRRTIRATLVRRGFTVLESANGAEGLELAKSQLPDLILCDINMLGLSGYDVLQRVQQHPATAAIPVVLITGDSEHHGLREGMNLGADDFLVKPFSPDSLLAAVGARIKRRQAVRQQATLEMEQLRRNIGQAVPHEMLTPLNGILATAELIEGNPALSPDVTELARVIISSGERLHRLISRFMRYTQLELMASRPGELAALWQSTSGPVDELVAAAAQAVAAEAQRAADLRLDLAGCTAPMLAEYFSQLCVELLDNAFKFSTAGTPVEVKVGLAADDIWLSVRDHGRGMGSDEIQRIGAFMQFQRGRYEQQGAGLGLVLARRIAEIHGGSLELNSQPGVGTEVLVRLPAVAPTPPQP